MNYFTSSLFRILLAFFFAVASKHEAEAQIGGLDPGFGGGQGFSVFSYPTPGLVLFSSLVRDSSGNLFVRSVEVAGVTKLRIRKFSPAGVPDTNFGSGGFIELPANLNLPTLRLTIDSKDRILVASGSGSEFTGFNAWIARYANNGAVDTSFGTNGVVEFAPSVPTGAALIRGISVLPDDSIFAAGEMHYFEGATRVGKILLVKLTDTGGPFPQFGTSGVKLLSIAELPSLSSGAIALGGTDVISLQSGSLLVTGYSIRKYPGTQNDRSDLLWVRLTANGELDAGFGTGGVVENIDPTGQIFTIAYQAAEQSDRRLLFFGRIHQMGTSVGLFRLTETGALDTTFANNGIYSSTANGISSAVVRFALQPNDQILLSNSERGQGSFSKPSVRRLTRDGQAEGNFGEQGTARINVTNDNFYALDSSVLWDPAGFAIGMANLNLPNAAANFRDRPVLFKIIADTNPALTLSGPSTGAVGATLQFSAQGGAAPGAAIESITWDLDGDGAFDDAAGASISFVPTSVGSKTISARVSDDNQLVSVGTTTVAISGDNAQVQSVKTSVKMSAKGQVTVQLRCVLVDRKCVGSFTIAKEGTVYAKSKFSIKAGKSAKVVVKLSSKGQKAIKKTKGGMLTDLKVTVTGSEPLLSGLLIKR